MNESEMTFHKLYKLYSNDVYRFAYWMTGSIEDAKDITSETFVRAWMADTQTRTRTAKAYLLTIARNLYLKSLRNKDRFSDVDEGIASQEIQPDKEAEVKHQLERVQKALNKLPEIDRTVMIMRAEQEMSYKEIAQATNLTISTVKVKVFRARIKINKMLQEG